MVVAPDGSVAGSVSGGCVEGAVYGRPPRWPGPACGAPRALRVSDDDAFAVGLTCGGILDIFIEPVSQATFPELDGVVDAITGHRPVAVATVIAHPDPDRVGRQLIIGPTPPSARWARLAPTPR